MTILKIVKYLTYIYISHVLVVERNYINQCAVNLVHLNYL